MGRNLEMPWSMEDTIENMDRIRDIMIKKVRSINLDGKAEKDVAEVNFDFSRVKKALEIQTQKIIKIKRWCSAYCPNCESELSEHHGDGYYTYPTYRDMCPECGQKIKWDESEA